MKKMSICLLSTLALAMAIPSTANASTGLSQEVTQPTNGKTEKEIGKLVFYNHKNKKLSIFYKNYRDIPEYYYYEEYSGNPTVGSYRGYLPVISVRKTSGGYQVTFEGTISAAYH